MSTTVGESTSSEDLTSDAVPTDGDRDPRETDHPVGDVQAERNIEDEPAG